MAQGEEPRILYSIQSTYILNVVSKHGKPMVTCDQRIDIPTIEPLVTARDETENSVTVIPCIELAADFLRGFNLTFETNEGVTVLPIEIEQINNPFKLLRHVLVLPRGSTGIKSCELIEKTGRFKIPHNFTFGIMPPPYNYENAVFEYLLNLV